MGRFGRCRPLDAARLAHVKPIVEGEEHQIANDGYARRHAADEEVHNW